MKKTTMLLVNITKIQKLNEWNYRIISHINAKLFLLSQKFVYSLLLLLCCSLFLHQLILCFERYNQKETSIQIEMTR